MLRIAGTIRGTVPAGTDPPALPAPGLPCLPRFGRWKGWSRITGTHGQP